MADVVEKFTKRPSNEEIWIFFCPGCKCNHSYTTRRPDDGSGPLWVMTGTPEHPTFRASLLYPDHPRRCHLFVTNGVIEFLSDCDHPLAGKSIQMEPIQ